MSAIATADEAEEKKHVAQAKRANPIISDTRAETLFNAACASGFVARFHASESEAVAAGEVNEMGPNDHIGLSLLAGCIASALFFELEGRE